MMTLGDAIPGGNTDALYTGESATSAWSMQYWRNKANEYQQVLNALDAGYQAAQNMLGLPIDEATAYALWDALDQFEAKKTQMRATAEAINLGAQAVNAAGGRFPVLSIPSGLGAVPLLLPAAAIAALGVAAALVVWGKTWLEGLNQRMREAQLLESTEDPEQRAALAASIQASAAAVDQANASSFSTVAQLIKWGSIGLIGFMAFQAYRAWR
jgi:hypothetical protein